MSLCLCTFLWRLCWLLWSLPHLRKLCRTVCESRGACCTIRLPRLLRKPPYVVILCTLPWSNGAFSLPLLIDIERTYGKRKAIAKRTSLLPPGSNNKGDDPAESSTIPSTVFNLPLQSDGYIPIPDIPGDSTTTDTDPETETEIEELAPNVAKAKHFSKRALSKLSRHQPNLSIESATSSDGLVRYGTSTSSQNASNRPRSTKVGILQKNKALSQHDLFNKYFRRDAVVLRNVDLLR